MYQDKFIIIGLLLTTSSLITGVLGYLYQLMLGNLLSPINFATFAAILSLYSFFFSPSNAIFMWVSRNVTIKSQKNFRELHSFFKNSITKTAIASLLIFGGVLYFSSDFNGYLGVDEWYVFPLIIFFVWIGALQTVCTAFFQGLQIYRLVSFVVLFSVTLKILASSIFLKYIEPHIFYALCGLGISVILTLILSVYYLQNKLSVSRVCKIDINYGDIFNKNKILFFLKEITPVLVASIAFTAMTQLDMFFVNMYFSEDQAGSYAVASIFGKVILYLPGGMVAALFPMVAANHANQLPSSDLLKRALGATILSSSFLCLLYYFFSYTIVEIFFGDKYPGAYLILRWYGFAMIPMALILVMENFLIAKGFTLFSWIFLLIVPLEFICIFYMHDFVWEIIAIIATSGFIVFIAGFIFLIFKSNLTKV